MAEYQLTPMPVLGTQSVRIGKNSIQPRPDLATVSVATPLGGKRTLESALKENLSINFPAATQTTHSGDYRAIRMTSDHILLVFTRATPDAESHIQGKLNGAGYSTDQTDTLAIIEISGPDVLAAMERLCPLDLHPEAFCVGASGRTVMEHMGATIIKTADQTYHLITASSSAGSFMHAVEASFQYTVSA